MMRLRTKFTLVMTSLVLFVVAVLSYVFASQLLEQLIQETDNRANDLALQVSLQAKHSLVEAAQQGLRPEVRVIVDSDLLVNEIQTRLRIGGIIVLVAILISTLLAAILSGIRLLQTAESS